MTTYKKLLTIAGSDSGGGAGIQADLKTFSALGCYGMSVVTALTAQNTVAVTAIHDVPPAFIKAQLDAVFSDIGVDAVKIGMLSTPEVIDTVANALEEYKPRFVVLDPVMVAKSGDKLLRDEAIHALKSRLIPMSTILTPNLPEAELAVGYGISTANLHTASQDLLNLTNAKQILITRGEDGMSLFGKDGTEFHIPAFNQTQVFDVTGAGDTVVAALTSALANGSSFWQASVLGNLAASIVVRQFGTTTTNTTEMVTALESLLNTDVA
jgi:hydroxymethylpyrimidine/phosphomethylpyrimidine kinase